MPSSGQPFQTTWSYKLVEIFVRLFGTRPVAHNAENDVMILLRCAVANKDEFVKTAEKMAVKFIDLKLE